jgi:hypothetical protein
VFRTVYTTFSTKIFKFKCDISIFSRLLCRLIWKMIIIMIKTIFKNYGIKLKNALGAIR